MVASPSRRRRIIQDQKWPQDCIVPFYSDAQEVIAGFIRRGAKDVSIIENAIERMLRSKPRSEWHERRFDASIEALKAFMNLAPDLDLSCYTMKQTSNRQPKLTMSTVELSVRPELLLEVHRKGKSKSAGAIKLCFSKSVRLSGEAAAYVGAILHNYVNTHVHPLGTAIPTDCKVIDVFAETIHVAPRTTKRRLKELHDACDEIAALWPRIPRPAARATRVRTGTA